MNLISVLGVGFCGAIFAVFLKQYKSEYSLVVTVITVIYVTFSAVGWLMPALSELKNLLNKARLSYSNLSVLIKSIGICYITQIASDVCKDSGQAAISSKIELVGRIALCICAIPLYREILSLVETIIGTVT